MRFVHFLVLLAVPLLASACNGPPAPQAGILAITVIEPPGSWGPITVTPDGGSEPLTLSQEGVSVEGSGSSR